METDKYYYVRYGENNCFIKYEKQEDLFVFGEIYILNDLGLERTTTIVGDLTDFKPIESDLFFKVKKIFETSRNLISTLCEYASRCGVSD